MKPMKPAAAFLAGLILAGCGSGVSSEPVSTNCSVDIDGSKMTVTLHAPAKDADVDSAKVTLLVPADKADQKSEDEYKDVFTSVVNAGKDEIEASRTDQGLELSVSMSDPEKIKEVIGSSEKDSLVYSDLYSEIKDSAFKCD